MHDLLRVGAGHARKYGIHERQRLRRGEGALLERVLEGAAFEQLHRDVDELLDHAEVEDRHDVRVLEGGEGSRLALETAAQRADTAHTLVEHLHGHRARMLGVRRAVHVTRGAGSDPGLEGVAVEAATEERVRCHAGKSIHRPRPRYPRPRCA